MALPPDRVTKTATAHVHDIALPYRGDGVAQALRLTYMPDAEPVPPELLALLITLDADNSVTDPG